MRRYYKSIHRMMTIGLVFLFTIGVLPLQQANASLPIVAYNVRTSAVYTNLQNALNAAGNGDTIGLMDNIAITPADSAIVYNNIGSTVTLDLYGYSITRTTPTGMLDGGDGATIQILAGTMGVQDSPTPSNPTPLGAIRLQDPFIDVGSAINIAADGTLNLLSGSLLGDGQGVFAYQQGATFNIMGGMVFGSGNTGGSEAIAATNGVRGSITGGYLGTRNPQAAMIWSASPLTSSLWNITGGYFTSDSYSDGSTQKIQNFVQNGSVITLPIPATQPLAGSTTFAYTLLPRQATPTANVDVMQETLAGLIPNTAYTVNGDTYTSDVNGELPLHEDWLGTNIAIVNPGDGKTTADSYAQQLLIPTRPPAPVVTADDTLDQIVGITNNMEYSIDGGNWTPYLSATPPQLSGTHTVKVRYAATLTPVPTLASESTPLTFTPAAAPTTGYNVTGTVVDSSSSTANAVAGATVQLYQGNTPVGNAGVTDGSGNFKLTGVANGAYNLVVTKGNQTVTYIVIVNNGDYNFGGQKLILPPGSMNSQVKISGTGTPDVAVGGLTDLFQDTQYSFQAADQQLINNGGKVNIALNVEKQSAATAVGAADLQKLIDGRTINLYLDMTLIKTQTTAANVSSTTMIPTVNKLLQIVVPYDSTNQQNVAVYRYHNGVAQWLPSLSYSASSPNSEGYMIDPARKQVIIWSQNFSTYAVASGNQLSSMGGGGGFTSGGGTANPTFAITLTPSAGGTISPASLPNVAQGSNQTLKFTPDAGYVIQDVIIDGKSVGAVNTYTFTNVRSAHSVKVVFAKASTTTNTNTVPASNEGLPYYWDGSKKVWIGFAAVVNSKMSYIAPAGKEVLFQPNAYSFSDMTDHWAVAPVSFVADREIFLGTGNGKFTPNEGMTRAMFAATIGRLYERSYGALEVSGKVAFTDVKANSWYGTYVNWAAQHGIIKGISTTAFAPDRAITREEMAAMLYRFASFMKLNNTVDNAHNLTYKDAGHIAAWAKPAVTFFGQKDVIHGRSITQFAPKQIATRAEAAAVVERFIELVVAQSAQ